MAPLRNNLSIFCEFGDFTQYAKNLVMVTGDLVRLETSMDISFGLGFVKVPSTIWVQFAIGGLTGVAVGSVVGVNVCVLGGTGVFVGGFVLVGLGVIVLDGVALGNTTNV